MYALDAYAALLANVPSLRTATPLSGVPPIRTAMSASRLLRLRIRLSASSSRSMSGYFSWKATSIGVMIRAPKRSALVTRTMPLSVVTCPVISRAIAVASSSIRSACGSRRSPAGATTYPSRVRRKSFVPSLSSRSRPVPDRRLVD